MYGLVNRAIRELVTARYGVERWRASAARAGVPGEFRLTQICPDEWTLSLVDAVAVETAQSPQDVWNVLGRYWLEHAARSGFGGLVDAAGSTFGAVLANLDQLHSRIGVSMPEVRPPSFRVEQVEDSVFRVRYRSHRDGLQPMAIGLLRGLAARFGMQAEVTVDVSARVGRDVVLVVRLREVACR